MTAPFAPGRNGIEIDLPEVVAEVTELFSKYEAALVSNDVEALDHYFWDDPRVVRYGVGENLYGHDEIAAFRAARPVVNLERDILRRVISAFGRDFATTSIEFRRVGSDRIGRQSQSWARMADGWRIVAAHVSLVSSGPPAGGHREAPTA